MNVIPERITKKISPEPNSGCWLWMGAANNCGYGMVSYAGKIRLAHRVVYELLRGPIAKDLQIDHLCRVPCCVNPQHLEPVTGKENIRRSPLAGGKHNSQKTHCPSGHPYNAVNTQFYKGWRHCRACNRIAQQARQS